MWGRVQTGLVGCISINDYYNDVIKKHEFTRPEKEVDRINNFDTCNANTEPIFLTYKKNDKINSMINQWIKFNKPVYDIKTPDGITHLLWNITDVQVVESIREIFETMDYLYIADGHHRTSSAAQVGIKRRQMNPNCTGEEEFNFIMSVAFPDEDLFIMDYNRAVKDLNGLTEEQFIAKIQEKFDIELYKGDGPCRPKMQHTFGMCLGKQWYLLKAKEGTFDAQDAIGKLDASILQNNLLKPILGIENPRTDKRIDFVGGIRGLKELEARVARDMKVAFAMYPVTIDEVMDVANAGEVMPPKSTWFEPKLASGLFIHSLE